MYFVAGIESINLVMNINNKMKSYYYSFKFIGYIFREIYYLIFRAKDSY